MIDLSRSSENRPAIGELTDDELHAFALETLSRLIAANLCDALIAAAGRVRAAAPGNVGRESFATALDDARASTTEALVPEIQSAVLTLAMNDLARRSSAAVSFRRTLAAATAALAAAIPAPEAL